MLTRRWAEAPTPFEENRSRLNAFVHALDERDESRACALIDELPAEDYVLHTGGSTVARQSTPAAATRRSACR